jgi:hypothetical protein
MATKTKSKVLAAFDPSDYDMDDSYNDWKDFLSDVQVNVLGSLKSTKLFAYSLDMGWNHRRGYTTLETEKASTLVDRLTPNSGDFTIEFTRTSVKSIIEVKVSHHDRPMGEVFYLMSQATATKRKIIDTYFN